MMDPIWLFRSNLPLADLKFLPRKSGIYYAVDRWGRVRYVGLSNNLHRRWNAKADRRHHKLSTLENIGHVKLYWRLVPEYRLEFEEAIEIQRHNPDLNELFPNPEDQKNWLIELEQLTVNLVLLLLIAGVGMGFQKTWIDPARRSTVRQAIEHLY